MVEDRLTSRSPVELAAKFADLSVELRGQSRPAVNKAAVALEDVFYREAMVSIRGPKLAGVKWGTISKKAQSVSNPTALVAYRGPVHWFESGTKAHTIMTSKAGGTKKSRGQMDYKKAVGSGLLELSGISYGGKVRWATTHPGMTARPFFGRVKREGPKVATRVYKQEGLIDPIRRAGFGH